MAKPGKRSSKKADDLLGRFPVTDLSRAVAVNGDARRRLLTGFVQGFPRGGSYSTVRTAVPRIYGAQFPLIPAPRESWENIAKSISSVCAPDSLAKNLLVGELLYAHASEEQYEATVIEPQVFRYGRGVAPIGISCYLTKHDRLIFQFPHFRTIALNDSEAKVLCSVVHHAYAVGDYAPAEVEIVQFIPTKGGAGKGLSRVTNLLCIDRAEILNRDRLATEIDDVYAILRSIAEE